LTQQLKVYSESFKEEVGGFISITGGFWLRVLPQCEHFEYVVIMFLILIEFSYLASTLQQQQQHVVIRFTLNNSL
jgi:hypothetical protein